MRLIDADKTMEEIPIDVCDGFEVTDIIEKIPTVQAIPIPDNATNGDMIKAMFPNSEIYTDVVNGIVDVEICEDNSELRCSVEWLNAPYRRGD